MNREELRMEGGGDPSLGDILTQRLDSQDERIMELEGHVSNLQGFLEACVMNMESALDKILGSPLDWEGVIENEGPTTIVGENDGN